MLQVSLCLAKYTELHLTERNISLSFEGKMRYLVAVTPLLIDSFHLYQSTLQNFIISLAFFVSASQIKDNFCFDYVGCIELHELNQEVGAWEKLQNS